MRAILINPWCRIIEQIEIGGDLKSMYGVLKCSAVCHVMLSPRDLLWLDDDGLLKDGIPIFRLRGYNHPLAGIGLILGVDHEGNNIPVDVRLNYIQSVVVWSDEESTGKLEPTTETIDDIKVGGVSVGKGAVFKVGAPILRKRKAP